MTLDVTDTLLSLAEVAAAFAGFAALANFYLSDRLVWGLSAVILLLLNYPLYLAALIFNICQAAFVFVRFVASEFSAKETDR